MTEDDLFTRIHGMVRTGDPMTCISAADTIQRKASALHEAIARAIYTRGAMTDQELEDLDRFRHYAYSSVRKRRTELCQAGLLVCIGVRKNKRGNMMQIWELAGRVPPSQKELFT
jgi:hypothetical protein